MTDQTHHDLCDQRAGLRACLSCVPSMFDLRGCKSLVQPDGGEGQVSRKGDHREAASERSGERSRGPTYRNRMEAGMVRTSEQVIAKSTSIKGHERKSGGRAVKKIELTSGDLRRAVGPCENTGRARLSGSQEP